MLELLDDMTVHILVHSILFFNILNWVIAEIKRMRAKMKKLFNCPHMHHLKSDVDRLYLSRPERGLGIVQL